MVSGKTGNVREQEPLDEIEGDGRLEVKTKDWLRAVYTIGYNQSLIDILETLPEDKSLRDVCLDLLHSAKELSWPKLVAKIRQGEIDCSTKN